MTLTSMATYQKETTTLHCTPQKPMHIPWYQRKDYKKSIARSRVASQDSSRHYFDKQEDFWRCITEDATAEEEIILGDYTFLGFRLYKLNYSVIHDYKDILISTARGQPD